MKKLRALFAGFGTLLLIILLNMHHFSAFAAETSTVTATVTLESISVTVDDGVVQYGTMPLSTAKSTIGADLDDEQTATNTSNVPADLNIRGQNSDDWTLASAGGANQYAHHFCTSSCDSPPTSFTALTTNYQTLTEELDPTETQGFHLRISTPTSSSSFDEQQVHVVVQAVAS